MASLQTPYEPKLGGESEKNPINLLRGWPSTSLLPAEPLKKASLAALSSPEIFTPASGLLYAPDAGYQPLREELAKWLGAFYKVSPDPKRLSISGGASQNVARILQSFTDPAYTQAVWMVAPCYFLACQIFADAGFQGRLRAVPEDDEGIDIEWIERGLEGFLNDGGAAEEPVYKKHSPFRKAYRHIIYCVPSFSNPSGKTMTLRRREQLVHLARKFDALIVADDVYDVLQWPAGPDHAVNAAHPITLHSTLLPRLVDIDIPLGRSEHDPEGQHFGHAISNGSFSKIVGPGMRTGWAEGTPDFTLGLSKTGSTCSGGAPSQMSAAIIHELLRSGDLDEHIEKVLKPAFQRRHALIMDAVRKYILPPGGIQVKPSSLVNEPGIYGGYFIWLSFETGPTAKIVAERCALEENLIIAPGGIFEVHGDEASVTLERNIRLCFTWETEDHLIEGVKRLGSVLNNLKIDPSWTAKGSTGGRAEEHK